MGPDELLTPQDRLERVWASLQMPDAHKLDMAIKYSSDDFHHKLEEVRQLPVLLLGYLSVQPSSHTILWLCNYSPICLMRLVANLANAK